MRIEVENSRLSLDEFAAKVEKAGEPVELTRRGEVVAKLFAINEKRRQAAFENARQLVAKARAHASKGPKLTERQRMKEINAGLREVRKRQHVQRGG